MHWNEAQARFALSFSIGWGAGAYVYGLACVYNRWPTRFVACATAVYIAYRVGKFALGQL